MREDYKRFGSRFTPTCVGKTYVVSLLCDTTLGSPPRVWGKRLSCEWLVVALSVHPHVFGENDLTHVPDPE